jgi:hypothetical protein
LEELEAVAVVVFVTLEGPAKSGEKLVSTAMTRSRIGM